MCAVLLNKHEHEVPPVFSGQNFPEQRQPQVTLDKELEMSGLRVIVCSCVSVQAVVFSCCNTVRSLQLGEGLYALLSGTFRNPQPGSFSKVLPVKLGGVLQYKWGRTAVQIGGVQRRFPFSKFRSQQGTALQMGGVLRYKLEVYYQYFSGKLYGLGVPEQFPCYFVLRMHARAHTHPVCMAYFFPFQAEGTMSGPYFRSFETQEWAISWVQVGQCQNQCF